MLIAPALLEEFYPDVHEVDPSTYGRLRSAWLSSEGATDTDKRAAARAFVGTLLEDTLGLDGWQKASGVDQSLKITLPSGETVKPSWVLPAVEGDAAIALLFDDSDRLGIGRSRRRHAQLVELLRRTGITIGILTNGRQLRIVHAGPDYDAWAEWDAASWFDESEGRASLSGLATLLGARREERAEVTGRLAEAIAASRNRQGDLAQVLGEQVRQAVELLVTELDATLAKDNDLRQSVWTDPQSGEALADDVVHAALFQAAIRIVMRLVLILYAESRDLLPSTVEAYHDSYGVEGLFRLLAGADRDASDDSASAWPRLLALFGLIHDGSPHPDLPVRAYGGQLFRRGNLKSGDAVLRALAVLERSNPDDNAVYRVLRLLKIGRIKVRAGRSSRWVAGAVDFSDLRTEYIGIVYEGLLDYELRRAPADDPIVFLNVGRQPALPLSRLDALPDTARKKLLETFKKDAVAAIEVEGDEAEPEEEEEEDELVDEETPFETDTDDEPELELAAAETDADSVTVVHRWAREAVLAAGRVRKSSRSEMTAEQEARLDADARKLIAGVVPPGRLYLIASGGLRKGSGSFYTRPALAVPLVQRTLEPLCYRTEDDGPTPRLPEEILALKICEPAMGSGSFLVAALRYLVDALVASLEHHGRILQRSERETIVTLPFGVPATGSEDEEVFDLPPEDERFLDRLRPRLARHVVERCLYGVDLNPMAVELARLALWVETLDRDLPFEFLDHKLRPGHSLVGCRLHLVDDYPIRALAREAGDGDKGELTKWLRAKYAEAKREMLDVIRALGGATTLFEGTALPATDIVATVRQAFAAIHDAPDDQREAAYADLVAGAEYQDLKRRMDLWCALWFWPAGNESLPLPKTWSELGEAASDELARIVGRERFFHWELEFPDVFTPGCSGFDAIVGNPPWEVSKPNSKEFFSSYDPMYRSYGKTEALTVQRELLASVDGLKERWLRYLGEFKSMSNFVKASATPTESSLGAGKAKTALADAWRDIRAKRPSLGDRDQPYRLQGAADLNTYKLFLETALFNLRESGRLGMLVPSGIYTDKGTTELRRHFLERCSWEWCYGFENKLKLFPIDSRFKFSTTVLAKGGATEHLKAAFMRHDVTEWEQPEHYAIELDLDQVRRFSPSTWSFMELKSDRDLDLADRIYGDRPLLGSVAEQYGGAYSAEFHMTNDAKHFVSVGRLQERALVSVGDDLRDPRVRARLRLAGYLPLYEGKSFWLHDPYFCGARENMSVSKVVAIDDVQNKAGDTAWTVPRLSMRNVASSTNQRTYVVGLLPVAAHGNSSPTLDGLSLDKALELNAVLSSLVVDYIVRMKVSANLNWFFLETIPVAEWEADVVPRVRDLTRRLHAVGADFGPAMHPDPLLDGEGRMAARLVLDALAASAYGLSPDDLAYIATQFPIYDAAVPVEHRYPRLAVEVFRTLKADGYEAAERRATELTTVRATAGLSFGLDELWVPAAGWRKANEEASSILGQTL